MHYYNEFDPHAAQWLRNLMDADLIPKGEVDERSITDVTADDVRGFTQCHFFAGIGGWALALRLAEWPDDRRVWSGSAPCQPFSAAGKRQAEKDERDLWPVFFNLIKEAKPEIVFGEQVASSEVIGTQLEASFLVAVQTGDFARANKLAKRLATSSSFHFTPRWITRIRADLAGADYALRWKVLGAHSVNAPHIRQRLYWVAESTNERHERSGLAWGWGNGSPDGSGDSRLEHNQGDRLEKHDQERSMFGGGRGDSGVVQPVGTRLEGYSGDGSDGGEPGRIGADTYRPTAEAGGDSGVGVTNGTGWYEGRIATSATRHGDSAQPTSSSHWSDYDLIHCGDGKTRRIESGLQPLVDGVPFRLADGRTREDCSRQKILHGIGNAIVPQVAAAFVKAYMETRPA